MFDRGDDPLRQPLVESRESLMDLCRRVGEDADRPALMVLVEDLLHDVGERAVAQIVEQRGHAPNDPVLRCDRVAFAELVEHPRHQIHHPERVGEARMLRSLIGVEGEPQLFDRTQPLELRRIDQGDEERVVRLVRIEADQIVNRVTIESFHRHLSASIRASAAAGSAGRRAARGRPAGYARARRARRRHRRPAHRAWGLPAPP